ncbi:hypothetical protein PENTCL1PPCAC_10233, partial [Pristionchus entomophagus]
NCKRLDCSVCAPLREIQANGNTSKAPCLYVIRNGQVTRSSSRTEENQDPTAAASDESAPDLFATSPPRKYTEQTLKTKGIEIEAQTPINSKLSDLNLNDLKYKGIDFNALFPSLNKGTDDYAILA